MTFQIRVADEQDAVGILRVKQAVWPEGSNDLELIKAVIEDSEHVTHVAEAEGKIAGFVDGFMTVESSGVRRWELDLIAVHPDYQNRGIATRLLIENTIIGRWRDAQIVRGLVEVSNTGSQRTFARCGYQTDGEIYGLYVFQNGDMTSPVQEAPMQIMLPPAAETGMYFVKTLNYTGIWLEDRWDSKRIRIVKREMDEYHLQLAGGVVPANLSNAISNLQAEGFEFIANFQWWKRDLRENELR